jgi:hypothetical protein
MIAADTIDSITAGVEFDFMADIALPRVAIESTICS